jgi:hypothetical protein
MLAFGQPYQSKDKFEFGVSDDKRAFTLTFSDFQLNLEGGKSATPIASRVFTIVVPVEGDEKWAEIAFGVNAFALTAEGATATIAISVNGRTTVADFSGNSEESIVQQLEFNGEKPSECRLCVFLLAGLDSKNPNGAASLSVSSIDGEFLPRPT